MITNLTDIGRVVIFPKRQGSNPNFPDYKVQLEMEQGKSYVLSVWKKRSKNGTEYYSGSVQSGDLQKDQYQKQDQPQQQPSNDEVPF